jgi:hypothetical protein
VGPKQASFVYCCKPCHVSVFIQVSSFFWEFIKHFLFEPLLGSSHFFSKRNHEFQSFRVVYENWPGFLKYNFRGWWELTKVSRFFFFIINQFHKCNNDWFSCPIFTTQMSIFINKQVNIYTQILRHRSKLKSDEIFCNFFFNIYNFISSHNFILCKKKHLDSSNFVFITMSCKSTSTYKIEIVYVYYIVMKIYVFVYTNIFSPFYFLCVTIMPHHSLTIDFTQL